MTSKMNWSKLLVGERYGTKPKKTEDGRSPFQKDIDKMIFSDSFRRLGRKTQVHPLNQNDHIHTRLSHSLEVACIGRSLGIKVGHLLKKNNELPKEIEPTNVGEIVQAACLAHDIGNPPFGHAGEEIIRNWFRELFEEGEKWKDKLQLKSQEKDFTRFDGNAMSFRIATNKEYFPGKGGMRLTYSTLASLLKYPWTSHFAGEKNKFGCFQTEYKILCKIAHKVGLTKSIQDDSELKTKFARHPLAFLVEAADDICYKLLDIEDAIELELLWKDFLEEKFKSMLELDSEQKSLLDDKCVSKRTKNGLLRGKIMEKIIVDVVKIFENHYDDIIKGGYESNLIETDESNICTQLNKIYQEMSEKVFFNKRKIMLEIGAYSTLDKILSVLTDAAYEVCCSKPFQFSYRTDLVLRRIGEVPIEIHEKSEKGKLGLYEAIMLVLDYATGMTDHFATEVNRKILGLGTEELNI